MATPTEGTARRRRAVAAAVVAGAVAATLAPGAAADGTPIPPAGAAPSAPPATTTSSASVSGAPIAASVSATPAGNRHTALPGDTMSSVASRNGVSVAALATANGRSAEAILPVGAQLTIPAASPPPGANGALALSTLTPIFSPRGPAYLAPDAAASWEAMRQASLRELGIDLYPFGSDSAYRSYATQVELWRLFQAGGPEAAPPGTSAHGVGKAIDLASFEMRRAVDLLGGRFGWAKTEAPSEWNHVNYVGG